MIIFFPNVIIFLSNVAFFGVVRFEILSHSTRILSNLEKYYQNSSGSIHPSFDNFSPKSIHFYYHIV